jgi:hypothetical protein
MTPSERTLPWLWFGVLLCACTFLGWSAHVRIRRVEYVSGLVGRANPVDATDTASPTGYAGRQRELIVPERIEDSFHWIEETQQMFAKGELRVRHVDFENAPAGRDVTSASPYRWWLGLAAWADHLRSGRPIGISVEHAAVYADHGLQVLFVVGATAFAAWRFGGFAAALLCAGLAGAFPFASLFLPGMPRQDGLAILCALGGVLALLAGIVGKGNRRPWFAAAGIAGGIAIWISVSIGVPLILGITLGAVAAAWIPNGSTLPWKTWSLCGGWTVFAAYLAEYFPDHMASWSLTSVHPFYGLAWIGLGEIVGRVAGWRRGGRNPWTVRDTFMVVFAAAFVATVPIDLWKTGGQGFLTRGLEWARLTALPGGPVAAGTAAMFSSGLPMLTAWAMILPLVALVPAGWILWGASSSPQLRAAVAVAMGPAAVSLAFAWREPSWWAVLDAALLGVIVAAAASEWRIGAVRGRWILALVALGFVVPGIALLSPVSFAGPATVLTPQESEQLVERHLAHWLAKRTGEPGIVVFAPPNETTTLCYFGGLRGIGTFAADNHIGFGNTIAIAAAKTMEEVQDDLQARGVRYVVLPSWDPFFSTFAQRYLVKELSGRTSLLVDELRRWNLPPWLQAVPYQMPVGGGFEGQSVRVFEVVDPQPPAAAAGRLAEYLVETGDLDAASAVAERLRRYPGDVGALAARAQVEGARGDLAAAGQTVASLLARLSGGGDRYLPWDRRVSLAVVLARVQRYDLAREQVRRCAADVSEARLRSLSTGSLYDLLVLAHSFNIEIADPALRDLALDLLPGDLRNRL